MSLHVKDGTVWKEAIPWVKDGTTWKAVKECWVKDGSTWKLAYSAVTVSIPAGTYEHAVLDPANATCTLSFNNTGTCSVSSGVSPLPPAWLSGGTPADYDISFDNGGTWANLGTSRTISVSKSVGIGTTTATFITKIRNATTLAVMATGSITLNATVDG